MQLQAFQPWERRDENDNIIRAGSYGKKSALTNAQNTGILDYIGNNLDVLNAGFTELADDVYRKADVYTKTQADERYVSKNGDTINGSLLATGTLTASQYLSIKAWEGYGEGIADIWFNNTNGIGCIHCKVNKFLLNDSPSSTDNSHMVATTKFVRDSSVSKSGDTMTGDLNFQSNVSVRINANNANNKNRGILFLDRYESDGTVRNFAGIGSYDSNNNNIGGVIGVMVNENTKEIYTMAPTPVSTDNSTQIATTAFCKGMIKSTIVQLGDIAISGYGYTSIASFKPNVQGTHLFCMIWTWGSDSKSVSFSVTAPGDYLIGTAGDTIYGLQLIYYYI